MNIRDKLSLIQSKFKAKKSRFNNFGKYNFRSAEDILEGLKPFNEKYNVYFTISEKMRSSFFKDESIPVIKSTATIHDAEGGLSIKAHAIVGVDLNQKGMQVPQQYGSASSYGKKYALGNLLLIDDTADADASNDHSGKTAKVTLTSKKDPLFAKAIKFVSEGGAVSAIAGKYDLSKEIKKALEDAQPMKTETL